MRSDSAMAFRGLLPFLFLVTHYLSLTLSCSISNFDDTYSDYPLCARACIACPDEDYLNNFFHNCNYASGECCRSQQHASIVATWECVKLSCGDAVSQSSFDYFVKYCSDHGSPLSEEDVPPGYVANGR